VPPTDDRAYDSQDLSEIVGGLPGTNVGCSGNNRQTPSIALHLDGSALGNGYSSNDSLGFFPQCQDTFDEISESEAFGYLPVLDYPGATQNASSVKPAWSLAVRSILWDICNLSPS